MKHLGQSPTTARNKPQQLRELCHPTDRKQDNKVDGDDDDDGGSDDGSDDGDEDDEWCTALMHGR